MVQTLVINGTLPADLMILDVSPLIDAIVGPTIPNKRLGINHPGNWPADAVYGISYRCVDRQFDVSGNRELNVEFFSNDEEWNEWVANKIEWIKGTDYDFSIDGDLYRWDWGPELIRHISM